MISTSSFDGHVTMYSLLGGGTHVHEEPVAQVTHYIHVLDVYMICLVSQVNVYIYTKSIN